MNRYFSKNEGFTLVELIVSIAIFSIIMTVIFSFFIFGNNVSAVGGNRYDIQTNVRKAASYITKEVRNSQTIDILSTSPATFDPQKKYIYVDGDSIKYSIGGASPINIINDSSGKLKASVIFSKDSESGKLLDFLINSNLSNHSYNLDTEIVIQNMESSDSVAGASSGSVIAFGPLTDSESVTTDCALLDLTNYNSGLVEAGDGSLTLPPPPVPSVLVLPATGPNGTTMTWSSSISSVIEASGSIHRPGTSGSDAVVTLTVTIQKGGQVSTKVFDITVKKLVPLVITTTSLPDGRNKVTYSDFQINAVGGDGTYVFTCNEASLPYGMHLSSGGILYGKPNISATPQTFNFTVTVNDASANSCSQSLTLTIQPQH